jgi:hypothetical protein
VILHAAPDVVAVAVYDEAHRLGARGRNLTRTIESPMCKLTILEGNAVVRDDVWPADSDIGTVVILPGGEAGVLKSWWNADDKSEWRWQVEFYNSAV